MLNSQYAPGRRLVNSARQLYFFQKKRAEKNAYHQEDIKEQKEEIIDEIEDSKVYELGYN